MEISTLDLIHICADMRLAKQKRQELIDACEDKGVAAMLGEDMPEKAKVLERMEAEVHRRLYANQ